ncbi:hypothetical protein Tco_1068157 [Tanacetum coccineum]|uniref:DUF6469 domain-containing protein n=1 Tax=Tanacetum coccineum TaxID=301880 RepID=A0ABQ5HFH3_9ASTR
MANTSSSITMSKQKQKKPLCRKLQGFLDVVFSWSLHDILNKDLYKYQVEELPLTFSSTAQYMDSFTYHLYEETHADLLSQLAGIFRAPVSSIYDVQRLPTGGHKELMYQMTLAGMKYEPKVGDLVALTEVKPKRINDLDRPNSPFLIAYVTKIIDQSPTRVQVLSSNVIESNSFEEKEQLKSFVVYLTNLTTNMRIWQALKPSGNMNVIQRTLSFTSPHEIDKLGCKKTKTQIQLYYL